MLNASKAPHTQSTKGKVSVFKSITHALRNARMGQVFSTKQADRLYVVTKRKWGTDPEQIINSRSAKSGFKSFADAKKYSKATKERHGNRLPDKPRGKK